MTYQNGAQLGGSRKTSGRMHLESRRNHAQSAAAVPVTVATEADPGIARRSAPDLVTHRLARALGRVSSAEDTCALALRFAVRAVPSRVASFALPSGDSELRIVATHGYPLAVVQDLHIRPGEGVAGTVFKCGKPLLVTSAESFPPSRQRRSRYQTDSFVALPALTGANVRGVMCLADRLDARPFSRADLAMLRTLMAPTGLALAGAYARQEAKVLAHAATVDSLSGLYNRRYLDARLKEELERARRQSTEVSLLMLDIDDFKAINDSYGHSGGDAVIADIADVLRGSVRVFDICTRFGGEEFAIVMPGSGADSALATAERIRQRIEAARWRDPLVANLRATVSVGLAVSRGGSARELIERADRALYAAKAEGKNRVKSFPAGS